LPRHIAIHSPQGQIIAPFFYCRSFMIEKKELRNQRGACSSDTDDQETECVLQRVRETRRRGRADFWRVVQGACREAQYSVSDQVASCCLRLGQATSLGKYFDFISGSERGFPCRLKSCPPLGNGFSRAHLCRNPVFEHHFVRNIHDILLSIPLAS
jgi:hypothetical protein